jgi:ABC-type glycerol-3-phosphate transport system substrate-binding protein
MSVRKILFELFTSFLIIVVGLAAQPVLPSRAQDKPVTITIAIPSFATDAIQDTLKDFESSHPGIKVQVVTKDTQIPSRVNNTDAYLKAVQDYVSSADVVYSDFNLLTPVSTRAGLLLDLAPLISGDASFNTDDFYPAVLKADTWDGGTWALPFSADAIVLTYKPDAFDRIGLAYPDSKWTIDDFANAARKLTQKNTNGEIVQAAVFAPGGTELAMLLHSLVGNSLFDSGASADMPVFTSPALEKMMDTWAKLQSEGVFASDLNAPIAVLNASIAGRLNTGRIAISSGGGTGSNTGGTPQPPSKTALSALPNGEVGLQTEAFAISAGTQHLDQAYALVNFFTQRSSRIMGFGSVPVRKSVSPTSSDPGFNAPLPADAQALITQAMTNGTPESELRYAPYLAEAWDQINKQHVEVHAALASAEVQAAKDLQAAATAKPKIKFVVAEPQTADLPAGKIRLKFGITSFIRPMPHQAEWDRLAKDFAANDPQVGAIDLQMNSTNDLATNASTYDCFSLPFNAVPGAKTNDLLSLDPFIDADKTFDKSDLFPTILAQVQQDGKTWAMPLMIEPDLLSYDPTQFQKANVPLPGANWSIADFNDALKTLKVNAAQPPFVPRSPGGTYLLMLIAANGGLPIDFRTNPPTYNFTDPATVAAIKTVLDQAKDGAIKYNSLGGTTAIMIMSADTKQAPITTRILLPLNPDRSDPYKTIPYPTGTQYNALSYGVDTAYISAKTPYGEACYRWLTTIAQHPELFSAMPARQSQISNGTLDSDTAATYKQIATLLQNSKTISFPSVFQGGVSPIGFLSQHWLYEAFDSYVLQGKDLDSALKDAQGFTTAFTTCISTIAPPDPGAAPQDYVQPYMDCAVKVDPRLKSLQAGTK